MEEGCAPKAERGPAGTLQHGLSTRQAAAASLSGSEQAGTAQEKETLSSLQLRCLTMFTLRAGKHGISHSNRRLLDKQGGPAGKGLRWVSS